MNVEVKILNEMTAQEWCSYPTEQDGVEQAVPPRVLRHHPVDLSAQPRFLIEYKLNSIVFFHFFLCHQILRINCIIQYIVSILYRKSYKILFFQSSFSNILKSRLYHQLINKLPLGSR